MDKEEVAYIWGFPSSSDGKESACNAGDLGAIPGLERSPGEGHGNPLQISCLENLVDGGAWQMMEDLGLINLMEQLTDLR